MADKKEDGKAAAAEGGGAAKSGLVKMLVLVAVAVVVAVAAAGGIYMFVLAPRLVPADPAAAAHGDADAAGEHGEAGDAHEEEAGHSMVDAAAVEFAEESVNVLPEVAGGKVALLSYQCAIVVPSAHMAELVGDKSRKPFFSSILLKLHSNRTKTEMNDPRVKESILRQAKQECNAIMKKLFPEDEHAEVLDVLHIKYTIFEI